jgi:LytR cell envelope-related transcriptional attenuator
MSNEESGFGATRRAPRQGIGGSPVGSWLTIALAVLAVILGFLILRNITDDGTSGEEGTTEEGSTPEGTSISSSLPPPEILDVTTAPTVAVEERTTAGAKVGVANANNVGGSAGDMSDVLAAVGYDVVDPVDSDESVSASIVYFDPAITGADAVANSVARDLGGLEVLAVETPAPTVSGDLGEAGVLVLLGENEAGKTIDELSAAAAGGAAAPPPDPTETSSSGSAAVTTPTSVA